MKASSLSGVKCGDERESPRTKDGMIAELLSMRINSDRKQIFIAHCSSRSDLTNSQNLRLSSIVWIGGKARNLYHVFRQLGGATKQKYNAAYLSNAVQYNCKEVRHLCKNNILRTMTHTSYTFATCS
jgi:hypothetical protein